MIDAPDIARIAEEVAREKLGREYVVRVEAEPKADWTGADAWRVLTVIAPNALTEVSGESFANYLVELQNRVQMAGDERFAFVHYATEEELAAGDDPEC